MSEQPIYPNVEEAVQQALAALPGGELWQTCFARGCRTEPVNLCCERCERHCKCREEIRYRVEMQAVAPGLLAEVEKHHELGGMER